MDDRDAGTTPTISAATAVLKRPAVRVLLALLVLALMYAMATGYVDGARAGYGL